jgi:hypothetical protein
MNARIPLLALLAITTTVATVHARFIEHKERHLSPTGLYGVTSPTGIKITMLGVGHHAWGRVLGVCLGSGVAFQQFPLPLRAGGG